MDIVAPCLLNFIFLTAASSYTILKCIKAKLAIYIEVTSYDVQQSLRVRPGSVCFAGAVEAMAFPVIGYESGALYCMSTGWSAMCCDLNV